MKNQTLETIIAELQWEIEENGSNAELQRKLTYYTMLDELARRLEEINEL